METFCLQNDGAIREKTGHALSQLLGSFYLARLESAVGIVSMPHAMRIVFNTPNGLIADENQKNSDPRLRVDTRLAMLSSLDPRVKYDPQAMEVAAWERLGL